MRQSIITKSTLSIPQQLGLEDVCEFSMLLSHHDSLKVSYKDSEGEHQRFFVVDLEFQSQLLRALGFEIGERMVSFYLEAKSSGIILVDVTKVCDNRIDELPWGSLVRDSSSIL